MQPRLTPSKESALSALTDPRREAFARAFVRCGNRAAAYRAAGFTGGRGAASQMAALAPVAARIVEVAQRRESIERAGLEDTIADLMAMAAGADALNSAAAFKEARLARLEAYRLGEALAAREADEVRPIDRELTEAEWDERFGHLYQR